MADSYNSYNSYTGDGVTLSFVYTFDLPSSASVGVVLNGVTQTTGYTIDTVTKSVVFSAAPAPGSSILLLRVTDLSRLNMFGQGAAFTGNTLDENFELLANVAQESSDTATRTSQLAIRVSAGEGGIAEVPSITSRKGKLFGWHGSTGAPIAVDAESGSASDVLLTLSQPTGASLIGAYFNAGAGNVQSALDAKVGVVATIDALRSVEPTADNKVVVVVEHTAGTGRGGGLFRSVLNGSGYSDNNGTVIKTSGGSAWLRENANDTVAVDCFGAVGNGTTLDNAAFLAADAYHAATGATIRIPAGTYKVLNLQLGGTYVADDGAILYGEIGATDNVLIPKIGFHLTGGTVRKKQTSWALHGAYGNCVRIGNYEQPADGSTPVYDVRMENVIMDAVQTSYTNQAMEILGDAYNISLINCTAKGPVGAALIAHWGGDVGYTGDSTNVTYSFHPHGIDIRNFRCDKDTAGLFPTTGVILSACYDVTIAGLYGIGMGRILDVTPGDVYNEVAVSRDKDKPCTGIRCTGVYADGPDPTNTGIPCIRVTGAPQNIRTSQVKYWAVDYNAKFDVTVEYTIRAYDVVFSIPLVLVNFCSNAKVTGTIIGGGRSTVWLHQTDYNRDCDIQVSSATAVAAFLRDRGSRNTRFTVDIQRDKSLAYASTNYGIEPQTFVSSTYLTDAAVVAGATSINIRGGAADGIVMAGSIIRNAGGGVLGRLLKTAHVVAGEANITTVQTTPLTSGLGTGLGLTFNLEEEGTTFTGSVSGFMRNVNLNGTRGVTFKNMSFNLAQRSHVYMQGDCRDISFEGCQFSGANTAADNIEPYDITCAPDTPISRIRIRNCRFEPEYLSSVAVGVYWPTVNNSACSISACKFGVLSTAGISVATSTIASAYNLLSQYDNTATAGTTLSTGSPAGMYVGSRFVGEAGGVPTTGYWKRGDILRTTNPVAPGQEGWINIGSGTPGTWRGMGSITG